MLKTMEELERQVVLRRLKFFNGRRCDTAISLGMGYRTLTNKLIRYRSQGFEIPPSGQHRLSSQLERERKGEQFETEPAR